LKTSLSTAVAHLTRSEANPRSVVTHTAANLSISHFLAVKRNPNEGVIVEPDSFWIGKVLSEADRHAVFFSLLSVSRIHCKIPTGEAGIDQGLSPDAPFSTDIKS